ncbi:hypothetical protein MBAV_003106 [Candidatus Magnetobacterium bavaricum]|uniref:Uncharacterized protein n=1 Tax=Candidatus Magnetobacterium bavaricum TaxID=29290 RepID=A0A0F3GVH2_9BACT|nr:hypothetical protein MBAV_003106 [Candidatus Magnetobacterium bavaricum]
MGKKSKDQAKRQALAKQKKQLKRKDKKYEGPLDPDTQYRPTLREDNSPTGFRIVSPSQALFEYSKPLKIYAPNDNGGTDEALEVGMSLWNYSARIKDVDEHTEKEIMKSVMTGLKVDENKADEIIKAMTDRFLYLFPMDMQPEEATFMYMRKDPLL